MSSLGILDAWRDLLPSGVAVSAGPLLDRASASITSGEWESVGAMGVDRTLEFSAGRIYAKSALSMLGVRDVELPVGFDRGPTWPAGVVGSITHTRHPRGGHCAAAVALIGVVRAIGIDVEFGRGLHPEIWPQFLTRREIDEIHGLTASEREHDALTLWCIKEAVAKALRKSIDPMEIEIELATTDAGPTRVWQVESVRGRPAGDLLHARSLYCSGYTLAAVVVPCRNESVKK